MIGESIVKKENIESENKVKKQNNKYAGLKDKIDDTIDIEGPIDILPEGFGFIHRTEGPPVYISGSQIQKFKLVSGDICGGKVRPPKDNEKYAAMLYLESVNGVPTREIISKMNSMMNAEDKGDQDRYKKIQSGILDVHADGFGFLRTNSGLSGEQDIYVAANQIRRYQLRTGDKIEGPVRRPGEGEKYDALLYVDKVNGDLPETVAHRPHFERLVPVFPDERLSLETEQDVIATRMIDLFAPIGKGQRGMIVAAPKAGKTTLLKNIANGIRQNHPNVNLIILLVDERPEEVTDMKRFIDAEIVYSTFDKPPENHIRAAEMVLERGKRLVEQGQDVVILVDSLTRLTRGNNLVIDPSGRTLSGGLDPEALYFPKKFFGSARNIEDGGSLTIIATALIDTGSRMDDIIFEEFKGTGNMELHLERSLAEHRVYPAIDLHQSGTRREERLLTPSELKVSYKIRNTLSDVSARQLTERVITTLGKTACNAEFVDKFLKKNETE